MVTLYSTGCPKCKVLKKKLDTKGIKYDEVSDTEIMMEKGILSVPVLEVDNKLLNFVDANKWINDNNVTEGNE